MKTEDDLGVPLPQLDREVLPVHENFVVFQYLKRLVDYFDGIEDRLLIRQMEDAEVLHDLAGEALVKLVLIPDIELVDFEEIVRAENEPQGFEIADTCNFLQLLHEEAERDIFPITASADKDLIFVVVGTAMS